MRMLSGLFPFCVVLTLVSQARAADFVLDQPPHDYWKHPLQDRFTRVKTDLESGRISLDRSNEQAFLVSLLKALQVPVSSQMLVFSTTSLQLSLITPSNPRALYFNEELYIGWVPGGKIEVVSIDPTVGGVFYIFNIPKGEQEPLRVERSERCMNCHAGADSRNVPGLVIKSVVPGPGGGSLTAYRIEQTGHDIPLKERFGGWYVTGAGSFTNHWGNLTGRLSPQGLATYALQPGKRFDWKRYPVATSDLLPQLLHEHQAGFVNRVTEATYSVRSWLHTDKGELTQEHVDQLKAQARALVRYLLFADEAQLPNGGIEGEAAFKSDFLLNRKPSRQGRSLKDLDLHTRLFKNRCSYMIYSSTFAGLPEPLKAEVFKQLRYALQADTSDYGYLPVAEKQAISTILRETMPALAGSW